LLNASTKSQKAVRASVVAVKRRCLTRSGWQHAEEALGDGLKALRTLAERH
jgi:hypothetical protein